MCRIRNSPLNFKDIKRNQNLSNIFEFLDEGNYGSYYIYTLKNTPIARFKTRNFTCIVWLKSLKGDFT